MLTGKNRIIIKISAILVVISVLTTAFCFRTFAEQDGESYDEPTSYTVITSTETPSSSKESSSKASSKESSSSRASSSSKPASSEDDNETSYHQTTSTEESSKVSTSTHNSSSKTVTSTILFDSTDEGVGDTSWGTDYSDASSSSSSSSSGVSSESTKKNIADYYTVMKNLLWLPILLGILSIATLIVVNTCAHKKNHITRRNRRGRRK